MEPKQTQKKAADTLLSKGQKITVQWLGMRFRFTIRDLYLGTLVAISEQAEKIKDIDFTDASAMAILGSSRRTAWPMAMAAAHGILNKKIKRTFLVRWLAWRIMNDMTPKDLFSLMNLLVLNSDPTSFFGCTTLLAQMNVLIERKKSKVGESKEEEPSGEQSRD